MARTRHNLWKFISYSVRVVVVVVIMALAVGIYNIEKNRPAPETSDDAGRPPVVIVMHVQPQMITRRWQGYGTARALNSTNVPARITATAQHIPENILEGESVQQGQLLVQLDDSDFVRQVEISHQNIADLNAQLQRLETEKKSWAARLQLADEAVALADTDYKRIKSAFTNNVAKQREVDQARQTLINAIREQVTAQEENHKLPPRESSLLAKLMAQQSTMRLAQQDVDRARITSPISGVLQAVDVEVGENVSSGQRIARVVNLDVIEVPLLLPASARPEIDINDVVELKATGGVDQNWQGQIARIAPEDDALRRTVTVYVVLGREELARSQSPMPPGKFVHGTVFSSAQQQRFIVPRRAMLGDHVFVVRDGVIARQPVDVDFHIEESFPSLGLMDTQWVVLAEPLPVGALVVADVGLSFRAGMVVKPVVAGATDVTARSDTAMPAGVTP